MKITRNVMPIADLYNELEENKLTINKTYQRSQGLWPANSRAFFIDTILNGFTFPKVTIRQKINMTTKKTAKEVIDGQQRLTTIKDFINNKFRLGNVSKKFNGYKFEDLDQDQQNDFLSYEVSIDSVVSGTDDEVLEIFRRINSYTLPLNSPEKRHAEFQGAFKWFIFDMVEKYSPMFEAYKILPLRAISRMEDSDLLTELVEIILNGITNRSPANLQKLYKNNDKVFEQQGEVEEKLVSTMDFIKVEFNDVCKSGLLNNYLLYSLFSALIYNKYGLVAIGHSMGIGDVRGEFVCNISSAKDNILKLLDAYENKDTNGDYGEFVKACSSSTHRIANRMIRLKWFVRALQDQLE